MNKKPFSHDKQADETVVTATDVAASSANAMPPPADAADTTPVVNPSRRAFLKGAAVLGAGLLISSLLPVSQMAAHAQAPGGGMPGSPRPWHIAMPLPNGSLNVSTGNVQLAIPITSWSGLSNVSFSLVFNSQRHRPVGTVLGANWTHSYNIYVDTSISGIARLVDGVGTETPYTQSGNSWIAPTGVYDTLIHNGNSTWTLTKKGGVQYQFNSAGLLTSIVNSSGNATTLTYANGLLIGIVDATGNHVLILQYANGTLSSVQDNQSGAIWQLQYGGVGPNQITYPAIGNNPAGMVHLGYDNSGNVNLLIDQLSRQWQFNYSGSTLQHFAGPGTISGTLSGAAPSGGWPASVTWVVTWQDIDGNTVAHGLDSVGRKAAQQDSAGNQTVYTFDTSNNVLSTQLPSGHTWQSTWNTQGNELTRTDPLGHQIVATYDSFGNALTRSDANNHTATFAYTTAGALNSITDANNHTAVFGVNAQGQTTSKTDAENRQWLYGSDANGFRNSEEDPLLNLTQWTNNAQGIVTQRIDARSRITNYTLDAWGQVIGVDYPTTSNPSLSFSYDGLGNILQMVDGTGTRTYGYNPQGNRISMTDPRGNTAATYDNRGRILTQTDVTGRQLTNTFNSLTQLTSTTDNSGQGGATYTYTVDGQISTIAYPNGTKTTYGYDNAGRPISLNHTNMNTSALLVGYTTTYDNGNRINQIVEQPSGDVTTFTYDNADNLLSEARTGIKPYSSTYTYDKSNRRKTALVVTNGFTTHNGTYTYDGAGRLSQVVDSATAPATTEVYTWNNDGTLASSPGAGYICLFDYDEEQHLVRIKHNTNGTITTAYEYGYAADGGRRWRKDYANNVWTWYPCGVACSAGELVEQTSDLTGNIWTTSALYLKSGSGCSAQIIRRNSEYHLFSMLGVAGVITDSTGAILSNDLYDLFGVRRYSQGQAQTPYRSSELAEEGLQAIGGNYYLPARAILLQKPMGVTKEECNEKKKLCDGDADRDHDLCEKIVTFFCGGGVVGAIWKCYKSSVVFCLAEGPLGPVICAVICAAIIGGGCAIAFWYCNKRRHDDGIVCFNQWKDCMSKVKVDTPVKPKSSA